MEKRVMVFGVFDGLHEGHKYFIDVAKRLGESLIIVVARDKVVQQLKRKKPTWHELKRREIVWQFLPEAIVVLGDDVQSEYQIVKKYKPSMICLGYDQNDLKKDLENTMNDGKLDKLKLIQLKPY